jgi:hypothetical protein
MKYLKIEISRTEYTDLYVEVPDDYAGVPQSRIMKEDIKLKIQERAAKLDRMHWEQDVTEVEGVSWTTAEEAKQYGVEDWTL